MEEKMNKLKKRLRKYYWNVSLWCEKRYIRIKLKVRKENE